jgi:CheY-like chemotaxis protein
MNMPVMDGMEFVGKVRNTPGYEDVPIIMVTTESEASQQTMAQKAGVTAFITKPFKPDALKAKILEVIAS